MFFFYSCSHSNCLWNEDFVNSPCDAYRSRRMILRTFGPVNNLSLEIVNTDSGMRMYINLYSLPPLPIPCDDSKTAVFVWIDDIQYQIEGERLLGGQRILLPNGTMQMLIDALVNRCKVIIEVGRYRAEIISTNFEEIFQNINEL